MKLGIFGGTFDPIHYGHLILADRCREACQLDQVWFVPAAAPPHKPDRAISPARNRAEMLELAVAGLPEFQVSRLEMQREGPSYTVDTLQQLSDEDPERELYLLLGADSLHDFGSWREPERIAQLARIVAVNRGAAPPLSQQALKDRLGESIAARIIHVEMPAVELSASEIRQRVGESRSVRFVTPRAVSAYIAEHGLYQGSTNEDHAMTSP